MSNESNSGRAFGGVSAVMHQPAAKGLRSFFEYSIPPAAFARFPNFSYHGGPVVACPKVYTCFFGTAWQSDVAHRNRAGRLNQFLTDLIASKYMNVLSQYGAGSGAGSGGFMRSTVVSNTAIDLTDGAIQATLQNCIDGGALPDPGSPANNCYIVYLMEGVGVRDGDIAMCEPSGDTAFGYHSHFPTKRGGRCYYAVIPSLDDTCLKRSCVNDGHCSLHLSQTQEQRQTQVTSHEFAEMVTDPELNAWWDPQFSENGDICNGQSATITVGPNTWTVQRTYSKADDLASNGARICLAEAPSPIPRLTPGPSGLAQEVAMRTLRPGSLSRLLPLPAARFDIESGVLTYDDQHIDDYINRLFAPLRWYDVAPNLADLLREFATAIERIAEVRHGAQAGVERDA